MKSGFPINNRFLRHPFMPCACRRVISLSSVSLLPLDLINDMISDRFFFVKTSGTEEFY